MSDYYLYQQRGGAKPAVVSHHKTGDEAKAAGRSLMRQWTEIGVAAPTLFACWNGYKSVEIWRDGKDVTEPGHYVNQVTDAGVTRPLSRAIRCF